MEPQEKEFPKRTVDQEIADLFHAFKPKQGEDPPGKDPHLLKLNQPWNFRIWDISQKYFFWEDNVLKASPLNSILPEQLMSVLPNNSLDQRRKPIFIGLTNMTKALFCVKLDKDQAQLQIVDKNIMDLYQKNEEFKNFTFFFKKTKVSDTTCCFESAAFPGWFLSTSLQPDKPVGLCCQGDAGITLFYFERKDLDKFGSIASYR